MYGKIRSEWKITGQKTVYTLEVPANTTATLFIKATHLNKVTEAGQKIKQLKGITYIGQKEDKLAFRLLSGTYEFIVEK